MSIHFRSTRNCFRATLEFSSVIYRFSLLFFCALALLQFATKRLAVQKRITSKEAKRRSFPLCSITSQRNYVLNYVPTVIGITDEPRFPKFLTPKSSEIIWTLCRFQREIAETCDGLTTDNSKAFQDTPCRGRNFSKKKGETLTRRSWVLFLSMLYPFSSVCLGECVSLDLSWIQIPACETQKNLMQFSGYLGRSLPLLAVLNFTVNVIILISNIIHEWKS